MFKFYKALTFFLRRIILVLPFFATAQNPVEAQQLIRFSRGFAYKAISGQSISLELQNNEVDLSPFVGMINRLKETDYAEDLLHMEKTIDRSIRKAITPLCEQSLSKDNCIKTAKNSLENAFDKVVKEKENQILYPESFYSVYERSPTEMNKILQRNNEILDRECQKGRDQRDLTIGIFLLHPNHWPELQDKLKYKDKDFLNEVLHTAYNRFKESYEYPEQCLDPANKNHRVCKKMQKNLAIIVQRFTYLTELVYGRDILKTTEAEAPCVDCVEEVLTQEVSTLDQLFSILEEHGFCSNPAPGEEKQSRGIIKN